MAAVSWGGGGGAKRCGTQLLYQACARTSVRDKQPETRSIAHTSAIRSPKVTFTGWDLTPFRHTPTSGFTGPNPPWLVGVRSTTSLSVGNTDNASSSDEDGMQQRGRRSKRAFFDPVALRHLLERKKKEVEQKSTTRMLKRVVRPAPEGWDVRVFLEKVGQFDEEHREAFTTAFPTWERLMLWQPESILSLAGTKRTERLRLRRKVTLFLHGLWPREVDDFSAFQAPMLAFQNCPWTPEDDKNLRRWALYYDVNFGDPWLYIAWKMQRTVADVHQRYVELVLIPEVLTKRGDCDISITKAFDPLRANRSFQLDPPFLFIIPSEKNFVTPRSSTEDPTLPAKFLAYYHEDCFKRNSRFRNKHNNDSTTSWKVADHRFEPVIPSDLQPGKENYPTTTAERGLFRKRRLRMRQAMSVEPNRVTNSPLYGAGSLWTDTSLVDEFPALRLPPDVKNQANQTETT